MNYKKIKLTQLIKTSLITLPIVLTSSAFASNDALDDRIQKLENLVIELKNTNEKAKESKSKHTYKFGGFIKATASFSDYSDGDIGAGSALRDFYIPAGIPVGGTSESQDFDFSAKETRINFKSKHKLDNGSVLTTTIEMDFLLPPGGNERVSNSYNPRLRHAFFTYDNWLFGQTWSTFQDVGALPESVDFLAASDGIVFERQPMVRYTSGAWQLAMENPETTVTPYQGGGRIVADDNSTPDFILRYNHKADWGHISVAALARQLSYNNGSNSETTSSTGISLTGKFKAGEKDDFKFNIASGSGMGRYVGLNTANGAVVNASGGLDAIDSVLSAIAYRHFWSNSIRSSFILSSMDIDNDTNLTGSSVTSSVNSFQINLMYSPVPKMTIGAGYLSANRELENGNDGDLNRLIFSAKYAF